jgi:hypothetical protein
MIEQAIAKAPPKIPGGYFIIARKLLDSGLMDKPPLYIKLWLWMLSKAFWKDGETLMRGQFITSIEAMRDAMIYQVGYRQMRPTRDEIRSPYEAFMKATMITTTKTTRGMIITICNYDTYQDFKSYEAHSEAHDENTTKPTVTPHDREGSNKEVNKPSSPKPIIPVSPDALRLSNMLADGILKNNSQNISLTNGKRDGSVQKWAADIDKLTRLDKRPPTEIEKVILWSQSDEFWKNNILSGSTLRMQWDRLTAKMAGEFGKTGYPKNNGADGGNTLADLRAKGLLV